MVERDIEAYLCKKIESIGGKAYKWIGVVSGLPDRIVLLPHGRVYFIELKSSTGRVSGIQAHRHRKLRALGFTVLVIDSKAGVDEFVLTNV